MKESKSTALAKSCNTKILELHNELTKLKIKGKVNSDITRQTSELAYLTADLAEAIALLEKQNDNLNFHLANEDRAREKLEIKHDDVSDKLQRIFSILNNG